MDVEQLFRGAYAVELFYRRPPIVDAHQLLEALRRRIGSVEFLQDPNEGERVSPAYLFMDHLTTYPDGNELPAQGAVLETKGPAESSQYAVSYEHSHKWRGGEDAVARSRHSLVVTDLMASGLAPSARLWLFNHLVLSVLEEAPAAAIHWLPAQQFVAPEAFIRAMEPGQAEDPLHGAVSVRRFSVQDARGDVVLDTMGLTALGLPDLQIHFRGLDAADVAELIYGYAAYLIANGEVMGHGETLRGLSDEDVWRCWVGESIAGPDRRIIDLDPGDVRRGGPNGPLEPAR